MPEYTLRESLKGFPVGQMFVISLIRLAEPIAFTSMFPYVYFMVRDFGIAKDENDISAYTGYLSAVFAFLQFLVSIHWSNLSEKVGRKYILLFGLFGTAVSMLIFGFSPNFYVAFFARTFLGAVNGNMAVIRTMIGELVTERDHQTLAFSLISVLWNFGAIIGPMIGGSKYLTKPKGSGFETDEVDYDADDLYHRFLNKYPYALSNVVVAMLLGCSILIGVLFLEETHGVHKNRRDIGLEVGDWIKRSLGYKVPSRYWSIQQKDFESDQVATEYDPLLANDDDENAIEDDSTVPQRFYGESETNLSDSNDSDPGVSVGPISRRLSSALIRTYSSETPIVRPALSRTASGSLSIVSTETSHGRTVITESGFNTDTFTKPVIETITANFLLCFQQIVLSEYLPVLLAGEFVREKVQFPFKITGGFGYDSSRIGTILSTTGFVGVLVAVFVYPFMDRHMSTIKSYRLAASIFPIVFFVLPYLMFTLHEYNPNIPSWVSLTLVYALSGIGSLSSATAFPGVFILLHRAILPQHRGLVNGTALSMTSLARCIAPLLWGWLISTCDKYSIGQVSWWLLGCVSIGSFIQACIMQEYTEDTKTIEHQTKLKRSQRQHQRQQESDLEHTEE